MYREYFGLHRDPFKVAPDPTLLYMSPSHKEALAQLIYGIKARKGFIVLTGEVGTGKTTLVHALMHELNGNARTALIFNTISNSKDLLRYICEDFGLLSADEKERDLHNYFVSLNQFLLESYRTGENVALIIDEAQNLAPEVLESVRLLSNFETSEDKLLQILLVGQPELAARLNSPDLRQLKQRVTLRHHLRPLSYYECSCYIAYRIEAAGGAMSVFSPSALESIYLYSGGTPRLVNILCDNGMLTAYALKKKAVEATMIREIAEDLCLTSTAESDREALGGPGLNRGEPLNREPESFPSSGLAVEPVGWQPAEKGRGWFELFFSLVALSLAMAGIVYFISTWTDSSPFFTAIK